MEVTRYTSMKNDGPVVAFLNLFIPQWGLHLNDCRLIRTKNGGFFVGFPSKKYEDDGETKYAPYVFFEKEVSEKFQKGAREAIDRYVANQKESQHVQPVQSDDVCPF